MAEPPVRTAAVVVSDEPAGIDFGDLQGLVRFGHGRLKEARFLLLKVADPEAARRWLQNAPVTSALKTDPPPETALQVAFTREGLEKLGVAGGRRAWLLGRVPRRYGGRREPFATPR